MKKNLEVVDLDYERERERGRGREGRGGGGESLRSLLIVVKLNNYINNG